MLAFLQGIAPWRGTSGGSPTVTKKRCCPAHEQDAKKMGINVGTIKGQHRHETEFILLCAVTTARSYLNSIPCSPGQSRPCWLLAHRQPQPGPTAPSPTNSSSLRRLEVLESAAEQVLNQRWRSQCSVEKGRAGLASPQTAAAPFLAVLDLRLPLARATIIDLPFQ